MALDTDSGFGVASQVQGSFFSVINIAQPLPKLSTGISLIRGVS